MLVTLDGGIVGFGSWEIPSAVRPLVQAFVCVDEDHAAVTLAADFLLDSISRESFSDYPTQLSLRLLPGHVTTKRIAIAHGFRSSADGSSNSTDLQKIALGRGVTTKNWACVCQQLKKGMGLELPDSIPSYHSLEQTILIKGPTGQTVNVPLLEVESLLSPALFCLPGRSGAIVPIRRVYAADLIGGAKQLSLLASPEAVLLRERLREELAKLRVEVNEEKSRTIDLAKGECFSFLGFEYRHVLSRNKVWRPQLVPKLKKRTALLAKLREIFQQHVSQPVARVVARINPILRGWVNYFAAGHSSRCFAFVRDWIDRKIRRHLMRARKRQGFGWKRMDGRELCRQLGLFDDYRVRRPLFPTQALRSATVS